jgi:hypothetical protein
LYLTSSSADGAAAAVAVAAAAPLLMDTTQRAHHISYMKARHGSLSSEIVLCELSRGKFDNATIAMKYSNMQCCISPCCHDACIVSHT